PFSIWVDLLKRVSVFTANLSINLEPLYGIVLAVIFFPQTEVMRPGFYLGAIIILAAVFLYPLIKRWRRNLINT
ncbi:MAG TPA: EamA family transporter, partial [Cyclobacteriaceae bacterium]|nr:EamA family transporter [Cyclobacteriaceae bacterium]